jgi:DMSO/TMAO reductase YedYZ molybdopterin-dependent catalytic subunit
MPTTEHTLVAQQKPELLQFDTPEVNAETPVHLLDDAVTPLDRLFIRNTGRLPDITPQDLAGWTLTIDGTVGRPSTWTLAELQQNFPAITQDAVLECAGNGRAFFELDTSVPPWTYGAVGCVRWTGVRLRDLLRQCEPAEVAVYTAHYAPDRAIDGKWPALSRGLPIEKALSPETMIAWAANGEPLPYLHGGPLRIVAPGYPGSAWHKWLTRITIRDREHDGERMTDLHYRLPRTPVQPGEPIDASQFEVITDMPVRSIITHPADGFRATAGETVLVRGFAWSGHIAVSHVEISTDGGRSWSTAELHEGTNRFAWRRFEKRLTLPKGSVEILARATDVAGNLQPLGSAPWNPRGYCNNAIQCIGGTIT